MFQRIPNEITSDNNLLKLSGLMPYNYVCVHAGRMLASLDSLDSLFSVSTLLQMALLAFVALGPGLIIKKSKLAESFRERKDQ